MGLFDNLAGMLGGGGGQGEDEERGEGAMNIVQSLVGGQGGGPSSNVVSSLLGGSGFGGFGQGGGQPGGPGGLAGILEQLAANGMGEHVSSWLSNNPNLPVSPQQIHDALGSEQVQQLAQQSGLPVGGFLQQLAQHLPNAASEASGADNG